MKTHTQSNHSTHSRANANHAFWGEENKIDHVSQSTSSLRPPVFSLRRSKEDPQQHKLAVQCKKDTANIQRWSGSEIQFQLTAESWDEEKGDVTDQELINLIQQLETLIVNNPRVFFDQKISIRGYDQAKIDAVAGEFTQISTQNGPADEDYNPHNEPYGFNRIELSYMMDSNALNAGRLSRFNNRQLAPVLQGFNTYIETGR